MQIPHDMLQASTLRALIEEFVTRDGTDYGEREISLEAKIEQVQRLLRSGKAAVVFDPESETTSIVTLS